MKYSAKINGIDVVAYYDDETIRNLFVPLLNRLSAMHAEKQNRILVMLAAPPGAGKSTLVSFLDDLAKETVPESASISPVMIRIRVVLPAPFMPTMAAFSPFSRWKVTSDRTVFSTNALDIW